MKYSKKLVILIIMENKKIQLTNKDIKYKPN